MSFKFHPLLPQTYVFGRASRWRYSNIVRFPGAGPRCEVYIATFFEEAKQWHGSPGIVVLPGTPLFRTEYLLLILMPIRSSVAYVLPVKCASSSTLPETRLPMMFGYGVQKIKHVRCSVGERNTYTNARERTDGEILLVDTIIG